MPPLYEASMTLGLPGLGKVHRRAAPALFALPPPPYPCPCPAIVAHYAHVSLFSFSFSFCSSTDLRNNKNLQYSREDFRLNFSHCAPAYFAYAIVRRALGQKVFLVCGPAGFVRNSFVCSPRSWVRESFFFFFRRSELLRSVGLHE